MKALKIVIIGGLAFLGGRYLYRMSRAGNKVVVQAGGKVEKVTLEGVVIKLKFNIKNPTAANIEMTAPLIKMLHNGDTLASSSMSLVEIPENVRSANGRIIIKPFNETGDITTSILLPFLSLVGTGANLVARLKNKLDPNAAQEPVKFTVETNAQLFTGGGNFPYDDVFDITV